MSRPPPPPPMGFANSAVPAATLKPSIPKSKMKTFNWTKITRVEGFFST